MRLVSARSTGRNEGSSLSERQWGTVREDYSENGDAWHFFTHNQARSRAYRWGEDGLAGISDDQQRLCFALAVWNGRDPMPQGAALRIDEQRGQPRRGREGFGLLDSTPTHSYHEVLSKFPRRRRIPTPIWWRPTAGIPEKTSNTNCSTPAPSRTTNTSTSSCIPPWEEVEDLVVEITAANRGPEATKLLHVRRRCFSRNDWSTWIAGGRTEPPRNRLSGKSRHRQA